MHCSRVLALLFLIVPFDETVRVGVRTAAQKSVADKPATVQVADYDPQEKDLGLGYVMQFPRTTKIVHMTGPLEYEGCASGDTFAKAFRDIEPFTKLLSGISDVPKVVVGGAVRDLLTTKTFDDKSFAKDIDMQTNLDKDAMKRRLDDAFDGDGDFVISAKFSVTVARGEETALSWT